MVTNINKNKQAKGKERVAWNKQWQTKVAFITRNSSQRLHANANITKHKQSTHPPHVAHVSMLIASISFGATQIRAPPRLSFRLPSCCCPTAAERHLPCHFALAPLPAGDLALPHVSPKKRPGSVWWGGKFQRLVCRCPIWWTSVGNKAQQISYLHLFTVVFLFFYGWA